MRAIYVNSFHHKSIKIGPYTTSRVEIIDLLKSWIVISFAVAYLDFFSFVNSSFMQKMIFSAITVGTAFLLHEIGHKVVAQRYGCFAEFRAQNSMLFFALIMALFRFPVIIFAPGAVMIAGPVGKRRNGIISAAGPGVNFGLAIIFLMLAFAFAGSALSQLYMIGYGVNTWIGLFNLIPAGMFDGKKIIRWSKGIYYSMLGLGLILLFSQSIIGVLL